MNSSSILSAVLAVMMSFTVATSTALAAKPSQLVIALGEEPTTGFDPIYGWGRYGDPLIQSTLLRRNAELNFYGDLAQHWQLSQDRLIWTVDLKPGIKFSDGNPLTAADVAFSYLTAKESATTHDLSNLADIKVVNPQQVKFILKQADITFLDQLAALGIVPEHSYNKNYGRHPIGSGPYILKHWQQGQQIQLSANPLYFGVKPKFDRLTIVFTDEDSRLALIKSGQLHLAAIPQRFATAITPPLRLWDINSVDNRGIVWPMLPPQVAQQPMIGNPVSQDLAIRLAIGHAVDRQLLVNAILNGYGSPAYSIADAMPWGLPVQPASKPSNIDDLKRTLNEAGWMDSNANGTLDKQGVEAQLTLWYKAGDSTREQLALVVASMIKPLGINIKVKAGSWEQIATQMHSNPVLMGFGSHSAKEVQFVHHSNFAGIDFFNSGYYKNPQVDAALDLASKAPSWQASLPFWQQAQQQIILDQPWTWLVNVDHLYAATGCLNLGKPVPEPHGHGWPLTANIGEWEWTCR